MVYRMILNQTSYFGRRTIATIPDELSKRGFTKALVVTDRVLVANGVAGKVTSQLDGAGFAFDVYDAVMPNPTIEAVRAGVKAFAASGADCLIAIGGASPQDTCKAIGIITANPEFSDVRSLEGVAGTKNPSVPIIAVPTTAGTAAEVTIDYVITDTQNAGKFVCVDPNDIPLVAVVDADMMAGMPAALKVATGMDALTHAIEGYATLGAWELTDALHLKAIEIIAASRPISVRGDEARGSGWPWASTSPAWASPTSAWDWCTRWPTRWAPSTTPRTGSPTRSCYRTPCGSTPSSRARSSATSPRPWGSPEPRR